MFHCPSVRRGEGVIRPHHFFRGGGWFVGYNVGFKVINVDSLNVLPELPRNNRGFFRLWCATEVRIRIYWVIIPTAENVIFPLQYRLGLTREHA